MNAAQPPQLGVVEALHAHAQPVDAHRAQGGESAGVGRAGVGLAGDLGVGLDVERLRGRHRGSRASRACGQNGGRAAANEDRVERAAWPRSLRSGAARISSHERAAYGSNKRVQTRVGVEVAVVAANGAERNVQIEGEREMSRVSAAPVFEAEAVAAHGDDVLVLLVAPRQALAQPAHQRVDGLLGDAAVQRVGPDRAHDVVAADDARSLP